MWFADGPIGAQRPDSGGSRKLAGQGAGVEFAGRVKGLIELALGKGCQRELLAGNSRWHLFRV